MAWPTRPVPPTWLNSRISASSTAKRSNASFGFTPLTISLTGCAARWTHPRSHDSKPKIRCSAWNYSAAASGTYGHELVV